MSIELLGLEAGSSKEECRSKLVNLPRKLIEKVAKEETMRNTIRERSMNLSLSLSLCLSHTHTHAENHPEQHENSTLIFKNMFLVFNSTIILVSYGLKNTGSNLSV